MRVGVIGLGLIGGSMARDLRKTGMTSALIGSDSNTSHADKALELGLVDELAEISALVKQADVIIVSVPVSVIQKILPGILDAVQESSVVIDAGSTKWNVCESVKDHPHRNRFVAAHPIAGTENSGPVAALDDLFRNKMNIVCEPERSSPQALETALRIFEALGLKTTFMDAREHDKHVAYVSHLSHVSSFLLGQTVLDIERDEKNIFTLAGSGFASTVRLAKSSPDMWTPIFEQNEQFLRKALEEYIAHLQKFHQALVTKNTEELYSIMTRANEIRRVLEGIELKQQKEIKTIA